MNSQSNEETMKLTKLKIERMNLYKQFGDHKISVEDLIHEDITITGKILELDKGNELNQTT